MKSFNKRNIERNLIIVGKIQEISVSIENLESRRYFALFAAGGPSPDDVIQGSTGDCYFCATLSDIARSDPGLIEQDVIQTGDNTYAVNFQQGGQTVTENVSVSGPTYNNSPVFTSGALLPVDGALWFPVIENAFTKFRNTANQTYQAIAAGNPSEVFGDLGCPNVNDVNVQSASQLDSEITNELAIGHSVVLDSKSGGWTDPVQGNFDNEPGVEFVGNHAYSVVGTNPDGSINLRNPWGG